MFQCVHAAAGLFNFGSHQLAAFFHLGQAKKIRQKVCKALHGIVQIGAGKGKAIGINVGRVTGAGLIPEHRHVHTHHIAAVGFQQHFLLGGHHGGVQLFVAHAGAGQHKVLVALGKPGLHTLAQGLVFAHQIQKLAHQLIALILQQLVAAQGRGQLAF